jgi:nanoRNase/pAp phosphatase (c-di-AMP/oligoRNAs hydrolase)
MSDLIETLERADEPVIITHQRADRDSLGAAIGLQALLGAGSICLPSGIKRSAQQMKDLTKAPIYEGCLPEDFDHAVVVDAPSLERIAPVTPDVVLLIDHHEPADLSERSEASLVDTTAGATTELVARIATSAGWEISPDAALPLLVGLLDDTAGLKDTGPQTATTATRLFTAVGEQATALPELLERSVHRDERIATATSTLRSHGYRAGDLFIAFSEVGAHEGIAAARLCDAGVDLAVVCSRQTNKVRVTARASERATDRISLGETVLPALASEFGGDGGGHAGAGTATLTTAETDAIIKRTLDIVAEELGVTFSEV